MSFFESDLGSTDRGRWVGTHVATNNGPHIVLYGAESLMPKEIIKARCLHETVSKAILERFRYLTSDGSKSKPAHEGTLRLTIVESAAFESAKFAFKALEFAEFGVANVAPPSPS